jgi:hypothetical protein
MAFFDMSEMFVDRKTKRFVAVTTKGERLEIEKKREGLFKKKTVWTIRLGSESYFINFLVPEKPELIEEQFEFKEGMGAAFRKWRSKGADDESVRRAFWKIVDNRAFAPRENFFRGSLIVASDKNIDTAEMDTYDVLEVRDAQRRFVSDIIARFERADGILLYHVETADRKDYYMFRVLVNDSYLWLLSEKKDINKSFPVIAIYKNPHFGQLVDPLSDKQLVDSASDKNSVSGKFKKAGRRYTSLKSLDEKFRAWLDGTPITLSEREITACDWPSKISETLIVAKIEFCHLVVCDEPEFRQNHIPKFRFITAYVEHFNELGVVTGVEIVEELVKKNAA